MAMNDWPYGRGSPLARTPHAGGVGRVGHEVGRVHSVREHLIVVVPGLGGSELAPPGKPDEPVWSVGLPAIRLLRHPELLSRSERLVPTQLVGSLRPVPFWTAVQGYDDLQAQLGAPHPTVLAAPYDFRLGVVAAAEQVDDRVRQRLSILWPDGNHHNRVIVVAHSLGGLVARYWVGPGTGADCCAAVITLGTPHWGAPKALDVLANGIPVRDGHVLPRLRDVLREWPSMVELLPRYRAVLDLSTPEDSDADRLRYPYQLDLPWAADPLKAYQVHEEIEQAWRVLPRDATTVVPRIGYGHGTPRSCTWDGASVQVSKTPPKWPHLGSWVGELGDGTVPAYSGLPVEMDHQPPDEFLVRARHGQLGALNEVAALVARYEGRGSLGVIRAARPPIATPPATLGLDVEEVHVAGEPAPVAAMIHNADPSGPRPAVWAQVTGTQSGVRVAELRLAYDEGTGAFRGELPALAPGEYSVTVTAREVAGAGDLESSYIVEVLDDADLG